MKFGPYGSKDMVCIGITKTGDILHAIDLRMKESIMFFFIALFLIACVGAITIYCLVQIYTIIDFYIIRRRQADEDRKKSMGKNSLMNPKNDDEIYKSRQDNASADENEYNKIYGTIQKSFDEYKTYNKKLEDYYKNVRNEPVPDKIDRTTLLPSNDDW